MSMSHRLAAEHAGRMENYRSRINSAGSSYGVDPAVIAGIISRESGAGEYLNNGSGDHGNAWGLMQVDKRYHTPRGGSDSQEHINQGTGILADCIRHEKFRSWSANDRLKGGIAAYNRGPDAVPSPSNVDANTADGNYSEDVLARAQWYRTNKNY